ncbi:MAG TPA: hypothetical protein VGF23_06880 [Gaiellaceae bacterium]|jgi:hypothetical protein
MEIERNSGRLVQLCERLASATTAREAEWRIDGEDKYIWERTEGAVSIASQDKDGAPPYELRIYNPAHEPVDELVSELASDDEPAPWNTALAQLYRAARRSAMRADDIIDALMEALPPARWERTASVG